MEETALKIELHDKIEHADLRQLQEIHWLITDYFNEPETLGEWASLSEEQKERTEESIRQADAGMGTPARDVIKRTREKYGLNG